LFAGLYLFAIHPKRKLEKPDPTQPWMKTFLGWTEAAIILVCVNLLFALFVGIQFKYFFGGNANITAARYTFSEYARRGFGELVTVAVLSLLLYLALGTITRHEKKTASRGFSVLSVALIGMVLVMLVSAFQRLLLYENAYGFTRLRTYPHIFMVWLGILLSFTVVLEIIHRRGKFALALLIISFGFCLTLSKRTVR
jgi:sterol desaturase/sphingolipid hydroxylase (fatty acid hydroxylase superfamily)